MAHETPPETAKDAIKKQMIKRIISSFLDVFVVCHFKNQEFSGYDVTKYINKKLNVWLSPGTIYATLYAMERQGFLLNSSKSKKRVLKVTEKGTLLGELFESPQELLDFMRALMEK